VLSTLLNKFMEKELVEYLRQLIASKDLFAELEIVEILQSFERGIFWIVFSEKEIQKFGGVENLKDLSAKILNNLN